MDHVATAIGSPSYIRHRHTFVVVYRTHMVIPSYRYTNTRTDLQNHVHGCRILRPNAPSVWLAMAASLSCSPFLVMYNQHYATQTPADPDRGVHLDTIPILAPSHVTLSWTWKRYATSSWGTLGICTAAATILYHLHHLCGPSGQSAVISLHYYLVAQGGSWRYI